MESVLRRVGWIFASMCIRKYKCELLMPSLGLRLIFLCIACASLGCGRRADDGVPTMPGARLPEPTLQKADTRHFVRVPVDTVHIDIAVENLFVRSLKVLADSTLLIHDESGKVLLRVSQNGTVKRVVGRGRGNGPGEHNLISNFGQLASGVIWTFDSNQNRMTMFGADGALRGTVPLDVSLQQAVLSGNSVYGYSLVEGGKILRLHAESGAFQEIVTGFGVASGSDENAPGLVWAGHMVKDPTGTAWFHVSSNTGGLLGFDSGLDAGLLFAVYGIDGQQTPTLRRDGDSYSFDPSAPLPVQLFVVNAWRNTLYVLAVHNESGDMILDAYSTADGTYLYSMRVPTSRGCAPVFVTDQDVYSRCQSGLVRLARIDT